VKDVNGDLLADSHDILNMRESYFFPLFNVHIVSEVTQAEMCTAEKLVPYRSHFDVEIAIAKLKHCKLPGSDQIPV
jgi:hypothetical protein